LKNENASLAYFIGLLEISNGVIHVKTLVYSESANDDCWFQADLVSGGGHSMSSLFFPYPFPFPLPLLLFLLPLSLLLFSCPGNKQLNLYSGQQRAMEANFDF
jgi:hypothetical protein